MPDTLDFVPEQSAKAEGIDFQEEEPEFQSGIIAPKDRRFSMYDVPVLVDKLSESPLPTYGMDVPTVSIPVALAKTVAGLGRGVVSPLGAAATALGPVEAAGPALRAGFGALGTKGLADIAAQQITTPEARPKTIPQAVELAGQVLPQLVMAAAPLVHAAVPETPKEVVAAAYKNPKTGEVTAGAFHKEAAAEQGVKVPEAKEARETPDYGFIVEDPKTGATEFKNRPETEPIAEASGQLVQEPERTGQPHSDDIAAPGTDTPIAETKVPEEVKREPLLPPAEPGETGEKGGGAAHVEEIPETGAGGEKYGIAARIREERAKAGQVEPVEPGKGIAAPDSVDRGRELLRGGAKAEDALTAFEQNKRLSSDDMALVRAHGEALAAGARTIEDQRGTESPEYQAAKKALTDWDKRSKAMQTEWHKTGMAQQGETDLDTGSFTGIARAYEQQTGKELPTEHKPTATRIAKGVKDATGEAATATVKLFDHIKKGPDIETAEKRALAAASRTVREADIRMAKAENDARSADAVLKRETQRLQEQTAAAAEKSTQTGVRKEAIVAARAESQRRVAAAEKIKAKSDAQLKSAQRAKEAAEAAVRRATAKAAEAERKLQADPIKRVWDQAKIYIEKGMDSFDDVRNKVATDLGMSVKQVTRIMAQNKPTKYLADDVWIKQYHARRLQQQAKQWVKNLSIPGYQKALEGVPKAMFRITVGFHGYVALGTHAPMVAFQPKFWNVYFQNYARMYKMIGRWSPKGQRAGVAYYESQVQDLLRNKNYITARRGGLVNDPFQQEELAIPGVVVSNLKSYISKPVAEWWNRFTGMGNRGYSVLKMVRQDMFDQVWDQLPKSTQIPEMAEELSTRINHVTGVTKAAAPKGLHVALFAPRLEASRVAWLVVDPAKAAATFLNWKKATPAERSFAVNQLKEKAWVAGTAGTLLAINQGFLSATGSDQKINVTDPMRSDFMKFKVAGSTVAYGNPMITMARMPIRIWTIGASDGGRLRNVVYPDEKAGTAFFDYIRSQMSPFAGTATTLVLRADPTGRPIPSSEQPMPMRLRRQGIEPFTWPEFVVKTFSPIPIQEALKDVWQEGLGMSEEQRKAYAKAMAKTILMGATGARINEDRYIGE